jgi:hypothetical protein
VRGRHAGKAADLIRRIDALVTCYQRAIEHICRVSKADRHPAARASSARTAAHPRAQQLLHVDRLGQESAGALVARATHWQTHWQTRWSTPAMIGTAFSTATRKATGLPLLADG